MINSKVIFFCRKNDFYSNLMKDFLKKKFSRVKIIHSSINNNQFVFGSKVNICKPNIFDDCQVAYELSNI